MFFAAGIGWGIYCLVTKSRDKTVTARDIKTLGDRVEKAINNLAKEIRAERESRSGKGKSDG